MAYKLKYTHYCISENMRLEAPEFLYYDTQHLIFLLGLEMVALRFLVAILIVLFLCPRSAEG